MRFKIVLLSSLPVDAVIAILPLKRVDQCTPIRRGPVLALLRAEGDHVKRPATSRAGCGIPFAGLFNPLGTQC